MHCPRCGASAAPTQTVCALCAAPFSAPLVPTPLPPLPSQGVPSPGTAELSLASMPRSLAHPASPRPNDGVLMGFLVSFQDEARGRYWPLHRGRNRVGRADTGQPVDVALPHATTSTHHAIVDCQEGRVTLADLGSTNGTFHNEQSVGFQGRRELRDGDRIRFGGFTAVLILLGPRV